MPFLVHEKGVDTDSLTEKGKNIRAHSLTTNDAENGLSLRIKNNNADYIFFLHSVIIFLG